MLQEYDHEIAEFLYYTPTEIDKQSPFWPVRAGSSVAKPHYRVGPRRIECYSIHFVREGSLLLESGGKRELLRAGDVFCMYPNNTYLYYKPDDNETLRLSWLAMDGPGMEQMLALAGFQPDKPVLAGRWTPGLQEEIERILEAMRTEGSGSVAACLELKGLMYRLFALFIRAGGEPTLEHHEDNGWVTDCMTYIRLHAAEGITVRQVAEYAGLNRTYFSTLFTKAAGVTPAGYIAAVKMNKAKEMLLTTSAAVTEIAYSLGYPTLYAFTRAFKNYYSVSPTAYRSRNR